MKQQEQYREFGGSYYDPKNPLRTGTRLTKRLENLGFKVEIRWGRRWVTQTAERSQRSGEYMSKEEWDFAERD